MTALAQIRAIALRNDLARDNDGGEPAPAPDPAAVADTAGDPAAGLRLHPGADVVMLVTRGLRQTRAVLDTIGWSHIPTGRIFLLLWKA
jgi:hypothetical protein